MAAFKRQIHRTFGIDPAEQIILAGPPYKPLTSLDKVRSHVAASVKCSCCVLKAKLAPLRTQWLSRPRVQSSRQEENIFVYNRKFFSKNANPPDPVALDPAEIAGKDVLSNISFICTTLLTHRQFAVPSKSSVECSQSVLSLCGSQNPLLSAVPSFEQSFKYEALKADAFAQAAARALESCHDSCRRQQVQAEALQAAVSNLNDYYDSAKSTFTDTALQFRQLQYSHGELLASFDRNFHKLSQVTLHKSLRTETRTTLMDCIPAEKVQHYKAECATKHERVEGLLNELDKYFEQVSQGVLGCIESDAINTGRFEEMQKLLANLAALVDGQQSDAATVKHSYENAKQSILEVLQSQPSEEGLRRAIPDTLSRLDSLLADTVTPAANRMAGRTTDIMSIKATFEQHQTALLELMYNTLRKVSQLQYTIQQITAYLTTLKRARPSQEEAFQHLEHIISLPSAYQGFLGEVMRRRLYLRLFEAKVQNATNDLAEFRNQETKLREEFMREHGRKLPPLFLELVPSLQEKPPFFSPNITQSASQWLPEVTMEDVLEATQQVSSVTLQSDESAKFREMIESWQMKVDAPEDDEEGGSLIFNEDPAYSQNAQERYHAMEYQNTLLLGRVSSMSARIEQLEAQLRESGVPVPESKVSLEIPAISGVSAASVSPASVPSAPPQEEKEKEEQKVEVAPTSQDLQQVCEALEAVIAEDPPLWGTVPELDDSAAASDLSRALGLIRHVQASAKGAVEHLQQQLQRSNAECERLSQQVGGSSLVQPKIAFREYVLRFVFCICERLHDSPFSLSFCLLWLQVQRGRRCSLHAHQPTRPEDLRGVPHGLPAPLLGPALSGGVQAAAGTRARVRARPDRVHRVRARYARRQPFQRPRGSRVLHADG